MSLRSDSSPVSGCKLELEFRSGSVETLNRCMLVVSVHTLLVNHIYRVNHSLNVQISLYISMRARQIQPVFTQQLENMIEGSEQDTSMNNSMFRSSEENASRVCDGEML